MEYNSASYARKLRISSCGAQMTTAELPKKGNPEWKFGTLREMLIACVGLSFGEHPEERLEEIRMHRAALADMIRSRLSLQPSHAVADIGSGCGFVGRAIAPHVRDLTCVDISPDFLKYCKEELASFNNVSYCLAKYAEFPGVITESLDACFSTAVFIHFNYYDLVYYLLEINRVLRTGGQLLFDIVNADILDVRSWEGFRAHLEGYKSGREEYIFNFVHPTSLRTIEQLAPQLGFSISLIEFVHGFPSNIIVMQKTGQAKPIAHRE
jgi:cyclopropane fatty-acyl-phospholipid synthase-like methyltransferase